MRRMLYLDGLRGWAALVVVFHHLELSFAPALQGPTDAVSPILGPFSFVADGPLAVAIFFILSGIVLAAATESTLRSRPQIGFTGLVVKRWLRLGLPIVVAGLAIFALFALVGDQTARIGALTGSGWISGLFPPKYQPQLIEVVREAVIGAFVGPQTPLHDPVLWTIRVEFIGSILVFCLCLFVRNGLVRMAACALSAAALIATPAWLPNFCALFALGVAMHELQRMELLHHPSETTTDSIWLDIAGLGMIVLGASIYPLLYLHAPSLMNRLGDLADPLGHMSQWTARSTLIVAGTMLAPSAQRFLAQPVSLFLGRISFGLYLLHIPLLWSIGAACYPMLDRHLGLMPAVALTSTLIVVCSALAAAIFHRLIEVPAIKLAAKAGSVRLLAD